MGAAFVSTTQTRIELDRSQSDHGTRLNARTVVTGAVSISYLGRRWEANRNALLINKVLFRIIGGMLLRSLQLPRPGGLQGSINLVGNYLEPLAHLYQKALPSLRGRKS